MKLLRPLHIVVLGLLLVSLCIAAIELAARHRWRELADETARADRQREAYGPLTEQVERFLEKRRDLELRIEVVSELSASSAEPSTLLQLLLGAREVGLRVARVRLEGRRLEVFASGQSPAAAELLNLRLQEHEQIASPLRQRERTLETGEEGPYGFVLETELQRRDLSVEPNRDGGEAR